MIDLLNSAPVSILGALVALACIVRLVIRVRRRHRTPLRFPTWCYVLLMLAWAFVLLVRLAHLARDAGLA